MTVTLRSAQAVAWRHLYKWIKQPANFLPTVLFPLFFFISFAGGLSGVTEIPGFEYEAGYTAFQFVFVTLQAAAFGGVATGFSIGADFDSGFIKRMWLIAPNRLSILLGYMASTFIRWCVIMLLISIIALASGMQVLGSPAEMFALFLLAALINLAGICWAAGVMFRGRSVQVAPLMQMPLFILLFLAPVYVPIALLEGWIEAVAQVNPFTYVLGAGRGLIAGYHDHVRTAALCAVGMALVMIVWAVTGLRRAERAG